ncbi:PAS domain-containing protein [Marinobacterium sp. AK62]|uniref:PAS domain-containing protein n=1 Tax=Marinobacterium alkalitolerans TaxID=1542925 RepID=A0ABS3Z8R6_9GAMM|nr:methyl-accepting chemotaxis protein [Marinobacterium alkalitolerans]MBP0048079.1 PAS domain-containing protein [Marinobacterium alkalitolerans]
MSNRTQPHAIEQLIVILTPEGLIRDTSPGFLDLSGFSQTSLNASSFDRLRHPEMPEGPFDDMRKTLKQGKPWMGVLQLASANGAPLWLDTYIIPVMENGTMLECHCILRQPSQAVIARASHIYGLRRQGKVPSALKRPALSFRQRTQLLVMSMVALAGLYGLFSHSLSVGFAIMLAAIFALGIGGSYWLCRDLNALVKSSRRIVQHPIKQLIYTGTHDDIGQIALSLSMLQSQLDAILIRMHYASEEVMHGARQSQEVMTRTCHEADEQRGALHQVASAIMQMNTTLEEMSASTAHTASETHQAREEIEQGLAVVEDAVERIRALDGSITDTANDVELLQSESQRIGTIISVINDIAEQTNLLALNAAIEAARAGENGRGFAVVADEVRQLAQRTQTATTEIDQMIVRLQQKTDRIVAAMDSKRTLSEQAVGHIDTTGNTLRELMSAIDTINDMAARIATASEQQSTATADVATRVQGLSDSAEQMAGDAETTLSLNSHAAGMAERQSYLINCIMKP